MSRILRAPRDRVLPAVLLDARAQADQIVASALVEAEQTRTTAEQEAIGIRETAFREGAERAASEAAALLQQASQRHVGALEVSESQVAALAVAAAEQILRAQIDLRPEAVQTIVRAVLDTAKRATRLRIRVHPDDAAVVSAMAGLEGAQLEEDDTLGRGDCVVQTELGALDGRLSVQLEALRRALS